MAIKLLSGRSLPYRVYWRNPFTGKVQTKHFATRREAEKHDSQVKHWLKHDPDQLRPEDAAPQSTELTVEVVVWAYLKDRGLKPNSLRDTVYHLQSVLPVIGGVAISALSKRDMRMLTTALRERGLKANGINRKISIIKAALNWAEETELIESNPVRAFSCPRGQDAQTPPPTPAELAGMLSVAYPHIQRVIILGLSFGVRVGQSEMFGLRWEHVDTTRWTLTVWSADKGGRMQYRELHIRESLRPIIAAWAAHDAAVGASHLINFHGNPVTTIKRAWKRTLDSAGITRRIRPYDLRHAHATEALAAGADVKAVAENMGHSDTTMIYRHYQHVLVKQRDHALESVPDLVIQSGNTSGYILDGFCITEEIKTQQ
jgi:integrase